MMILIVLMVTHYDDDDGIRVMIVKRVVINALMSVDG
jgi:hypothetical protein